MEDTSIPELVKQLPEDAQKLWKAGYRPTRKGKKWYLQRRIGKSVKALFMAKEYSPVMKALYEELHKAAPEDIESEGAIHRERKDERKPIRLKEIEDAAWFHNLLHDLGKFTYHRLVQKVEWGEEEIADCEAAFKRLSARVDALLAMEQDPELLERLELENMRLEAIAFTFKDLWERASESLRVYKWYTDLLIASMDLNSRQRALNQIVASSAIRVAPEALAGGAS